MTFDHWWASLPDDFCEQIGNTGTLDQMRVAWNAGVAAERERCAKMVKDYDGDEGLVALAERIRKGGGK